MRSTQRTPAMLSMPRISSKCILDMKGMNRMDKANSMHAACIYRGVHMNHQIKDMT